MSNRGVKAQENPPPELKSKQRNGDDLEGSSRESFQTFAKGGQIGVLMRPLVLRRGSFYCELQNYLHFPGDSMNL